MIRTHQDMNRPLSVHTGLSVPNDLLEEVLCAGDYAYWHYGCDGVDDRGWGCGYRTVQTIADWIRRQQELSAVDKPPDVPSIRHIQKILTEFDDKPPSFLGSKDWIGCFEACLVLECVFGVPGKLVHVRSGKDLSLHLETLSSHLRTNGAPVMLGGDGDASAKMVVGTALAADSRRFLLVVDPHFWGQAETCRLQEDGWVRWMDMQDFMQNSFYNLYLPQCKAHQLMPR